MLDGEKVIKGLEEISDYFFDIYRNEKNGYSPAQEYCNVAEEALALLKEQEEIINELLGLGYPHNFQHEAPWVVDYLYSLTEIIKKAFKAKEGR